jgi:uncharacterized protein (DUF488 family)
METLYTIGHSNHSPERFLELLRLHAITAVADVRSRPYSRYNPHFDRESLQSLLKQSAIHYGFLGDQLGARSETPSCYVDGKVQYDRLARTEPFLQGLARVEKGASTFRLALLCAEKEPLDCHRSILVARHLCLRGYHVLHILEDGRLESQPELLARLASQLHLRIDEQHLFRTPQDLLDDAYALQEKRIAFELPELTPDSSTA